MVEGLCNAGTAFQDRMDTMFTVLPQRVRDDTLVYFDDINGGVNDENALLYNLEHIFSCVAASDVTLKPSKAKIGYPTTSFGGFSHGYGYRWLLKNTCSLSSIASHRKMWRSYGVRWDFSSKLDIS